jgi:hypothetical protein
MIDMFNCKDFDGELRLLMDPQILCWQGLHTYESSMTLALVCFIFWGLGIPLVIYVLMSKEKD